MVYRKDGDIANVPGSAPGLADSLLREKPSQGVPSERNNHFRLYKLYLPVQVFATGLDFAWEWIPVVGRTTLHHVGDIDILALHADLSKELLQELPSGPNEWPPLLVFPKPGRLSYKHEVSRLRSLSRDSAGPIAGQLAVLTGVYLNGNVLKLGQ